MVSAWAARGKSKDGDEGSETEEGPIHKGFSYRVCSGKARAFLDEGESPERLIEIADADDDFVRKVRSYALLMTGPGP